jgi:hypothetical protein
MEYLHLLFKEADKKYATYVIVIYEWFKIIKQ